MILNLKSKVCKITGIPMSHFKPEYQNTDEFCTIKELIDNPDTIEIFRFINCYNDNIDFSNDVYKYLDIIKKMVAF